MSDPVDRGAVIDELRACTIEAATLYGTNDALKTAFKEALRGINDLPNVEAERKRGRWIEHDSDEDKYDVIKCSCCKHMFTVDSYHWTDIGFVKDDFKFCPNCGADMRGRSEDE